MGREQVLADWIDPDLARHDIGWFPSQEEAQRRAQAYYEARMPVMSLLRWERVSPGAWMLLDGTQMTRVMTRWADPGQMALLDRLMDTPKGRAMRDRARRMRAGEGGEALPGREDNVADIREWLRRRNPAGGE